MGFFEGLARRLAMAAMILSLAACDPGVVSERPVTARAATGDATLAAERVRTLTDDMWTYTIENSTYLRLMDGLPIEKFEDLTLESHHDIQVRSAVWRSRLADIDAEALQGDDLITYEILAFELEDVGANDADFWLQFDVTPYIAPYKFRFAQQALAGQRISDKASADHYLRLVGEYADMIDQLNMKLAGQIERGILLPQPALASTRATWTGIRDAAPAAIAVADDRLAPLSPDDKASFLAALSTLIENRVDAGFGSLLAALGDDYEKRAPATVGIGQYENGQAVYRRRVRAATTLELSPNEIHERGKKAVAEIATRMQAVRDTLGFAGTAREFHEQLKVDRRFIAASPAEVEQRYLSFIHKIEPELDSYFRHRPKAAYSVRRLPPAAEAGMTFGYYSPPTASDPVGFYNYNGSDLANRSLIGAGSLIYHELLPGHHFHIATQVENATLHKYRQKYSVAAFTEGWAEYAASLGIEMGMYETPYDLYGRYIMEIFLATRLVVDTGMNSLGWTLEEARAFMSEHLFHSDVEIASESLRYSTSLPAQALAYRLGYEKIWELRRRAEQALGDKFDVRDFHEVVLSDGSKPLVVLEAKVNRYIAATAAN